MGPPLIALVAWLKGAAHASYRTIQALLRDVLRVRLTGGQLAQLVHKSSQALEASYAELREELPRQGFLNVDETGHKERGKNLWTRCFGAPQYSLFAIECWRGSKVLVQVLGREFDGVLGCDYWSPHATLYTRGFSCFVSSTTAALAIGWRDSCRAGMTPADVLRLCHGPRNNLAAQALRFVALDRRITQGTCGEAGRIRTADATCRKQGRSLYEFLCPALDAHFSSHHARSPGRLSQTP